MKAFKLSERQWKFARDVGSVVLGVLIALGIGEIAEAIRWQKREAAALRMINAELAYNAGALQERVLIQPCLNRRLDELLAVLREAELKGRLPDIGTVGRPPLRPLSRAAWDVAINSGVTLHMDAREVTDIAFYVEATSGYVSVAETEQEAWAALATIEGQARPASEDLLAEMMKTLAVLKYRNLVAGVAAQQSLEWTKARGIQPVWDVIGAPKGLSMNSLSAQLRARPICRPIQLRAG
jgi:hypothetical protein